MIKIPGRKCPDCGLVNDISVDECVCGEDISYMPQSLYDIDTLAPEQRGTFNEELEFYVQKCPMCGKDNYTARVKSPVKRCFSCAKAKISSVEPVLYTENTPKPKAPEKEEPKEVKEEPKEVKPEPTKEKEEIKEEPKAVEEPVSLLDDLFADEADFDNETAEPAPDADTTAENAPANEEPAKADEQPAGMPERKDWSFRLGEMDEYDYSVKSIVFTAVRYGVHSFMITPEMVIERPFMLGRSAGESEFLSKDPRVSSFHCTVFINNGQWYIQDNNSTNGTFVDDTDLGEGGCTDLQAGDMVKLGHSVDSMEFRVSFE